MNTDMQWFQLTCRDFLGFVVKWKFASFRLVCTSFRFRQKEIRNLFQRKKWKRRKKELRRKNVTREEKRGRDCLLHLLLESLIYFRFLIKKRVRFENQVMRSISISFRWRQLTHSSFLFIHTIRKRNSQSWEEDKPSQRKEKKKNSFPSWNFLCVLSVLPPFSSWR